MSPKIEFSLFLILFLLENTRYDHKQKFQFSFCGGRGLSFLEVSETKCSEKVQIVWREVTIRSDKLREIQTTPEQFKGIQ